MPAIKLEKINPNAWWCVWEMTETLSQLERNTFLSPEGEAEINGMKHERKKMESLAARRCLQEIFASMGLKYHGIHKDEHDKPHLIGYNFYISISHSYPLAAAILHKKLRVGIDVEKPIEKLVRVSRKFLSEQEFYHAGEDLRKLCIYWTGKEAIFKLNGKTGLHFRDNIKIYPFEPSKRDVIRSEITLPGHEIKIALNYREILGHYVSFCF